MWVIRSNRRFYSQGPNPHWYTNPCLATHFEEDEDAHTEAREVLQLEPTDYVVDPYYPDTKPRLPNGGVRPYRPASRPTR